MENFNFEKTIGGRLVAELRKELMQAIFVPNSMLPEKFHDKSRGGRSLARLDELCAKRDGEYTAHQKAKAAKARNIERLTKQAEALSVYTKGGDFIDLKHGFDYSECEIDEHALYRNECVMVNGMVNGGLIEIDDLLED
jgi:hypothetical protein